MKLRITEAYYWHVVRPSRKLFRAIIWKLPDSVVYWCVVRAACKVEPNSNPSGVTAAQMMDAFAPKGDRV